MTASRPSDPARRPAVPRPALAAMAGLAVAVTVLLPTMPSGAHPSDRDSRSTSGVSTGGDDLTVGTTAPPTTAPSRLAPIGGDDTGGAGGLTTRTTAPGDTTRPRDITGTPAERHSYQDCFVDFDNDIIISILPDNAIATFVQWPYWVQQCNLDGANIAIEPVETDHYHLGYEDPRIGLCLDIGTFGRHDEPQPADEDDLIEWVASPCTEIDPVTEPRSAIQPHTEGYSTKVFAYDDDGEAVPFALTRLRIVSGESSVCHLPPGPWEAAGPGGSPWSCIELDPGYYDLSAIVDSAIEVRIEALTPGNEIDDIGLDVL